MGYQKKLPRGMFLRGGIYYGRWKQAGRMVRKSLSDDFETACTLLKTLRARADLATGDHLDNNYSLDELQEKWFKSLRQTARPSTVKRYRENLNYIRDGLGATKVQHLRKSDIIDYRADRLEAGASPRTVNMEVMALHAMVNFGVANDLIGSNPINRIKQLPNDSPRKIRRELTPQEIDRLFLNSPTLLRPVWYAYLTTGMRKEEVIELLFSDVDFDRRVINVRAANAKGRRPREIPICDGLFVNLIRLRDARPACRPVVRHKNSFSRDHVFVNRVNAPWRDNLLRNFYACCKKADIKDGIAHGSVDIHSLRVTFATLSLAAGANPRDVQYILGHATLDMTMAIYAKSTAGGRRKAIENLPFTSPNIVSLPQDPNDTIQETSKTERDSGTRESQNDDSLNYKAL